MPGGIASNTKIYTYGSQIVSSGGSAVKSTASGGNIDVLSGGKIIGTTINDSSYVRLQSGAISVRATINSGGTLYFGLQYSYPIRGGIASQTYVKNGAEFVVNGGGSAIGTVVSSGGYMLMSSSYSDTNLPTASKTSIKNGGFLDVAGGTITSTTISNGGSMHIGTSQNYYYSSSFISGRTIKVLSGGTLYGDYNSYLTGVTINKGANFTGRSSYVSGMTVKSGGNAAFDSSEVRGTLTAKGANLSFASANNVTSMVTDAKTNILLNISGLSPYQYYNSIDNALLHTSVRKAIAGKYTINASKLQTIGTYSLSTNNALANKKAFTLNIEDSKVGTLKLNSGSLTKNGVTHTLSKESGTNQHITLNLSLKAGKMLTGTSAAETLTGTNHSDIFYGGAGDDVIDGKNGRDVVIYDTNDWGTDTIKATDGTMTILFKDLKSSDVTRVSSGSDVTIQRIGYADQKITFTNWSDDAYTMAFGGLEGMSNFDTYLSSASPTSSATSAARSEVWSKAGLYSA